MPWSPRHAYSARPLSTPTDDDGDGDLMDTLGDEEAAVRAPRGQLARAVGARGARRAGTPDRRAPLLPRPDAVADRGRDRHLPDARVPPPPARARDDARPAGAERRRSGGAHERGGRIQDVVLRMPAKAGVPGAGPAGALRARPLGRARPGGAGDLKLAVTEACANAARHAYEDEGRVTLRLLADESEVRIEIEDEGAGFAGIHGEPEPELLPEDGMGLAIIRRGGGRAAGGLRRGRPRHQAAPPEAPVGATLGRPGRAQPGRWRSCDPPGIVAPTREAASTVGAERERAVEQRDLEDPPHGRSGLDEPQLPVALPHPAQGTDEHAERARVEERDAAAGR